MNYPEKKNQMKKKPRMYICLEQDHGNLNGIQISSLENYVPKDFSGIITGMRYLGYIYIYIAFISRVANGPAETHNPLKQMGQLRPTSINRLWD